MFQREDLIPSVEKSGVYVHTAKPLGTAHATPIGMPISIAEAMATGAHMLVHVHELRAYLGDAGTAYRNVDHAAKIITAVAAWPDKVWQQAWLSSVERAFSTHADELALRPIFESWCAIVERNGLRRA